jgi:hypothetical protein
MSTSGCQAAATVELCRGSNAKVLPGLDYQPAGSVSVDWYSATRRMVSCFTNLRWVRTGKAFPAGFGFGAAACANASRAGLSGIDASTDTSADGGRMRVGKLVSITMRSGHRWAELTRIIDLSNRASANRVDGAAGKYCSAMKSIPKSRLPTIKKYRPRGILIDRCLGWNCKLSGDNCPGVLRFLVRLRIDFLFQSPRHRFHGRVPKINFQNCNPFLPTIRHLCPSLRVIGRALTSSSSV